MAMKDEVRLTVPARPEFLRLARVTAAGLASRLGFSFDEVEDLRLAIDEICYGMTGTDGREGTVRVRYLLGGDRLTVEGQLVLDPVDGSTVDGSTNGRSVAGNGSSGQGTNGKGRDAHDANGGSEVADLPELSQVILSALVDEHELADDAGGLRFRLMKAHHDLEPDLIP
jgi:serine/threonine-protein kinase RsbW